MSQWKMTEGQKFLTVQPSRQESQWSALSDWIPGSLPSPPHLGEGVKNFIARISFKTALSRRCPAYWLLRKDRMPS